VNLPRKEDYYNKSEIIDFSKRASEIVRYYDKTIVIDKHLPREPERVIKESIKRSCSQIVFSAPYEKGKRNSSFVNPNLISQFSLAHCQAV